MIGVEWGARALQVAFQSGAAGSSHQRRHELKKIIIERRHQGPFGAANGGYVAGILGDALGGAPSSVRLHQPIPVDTPIFVYRRGDTAFIRHDDRTVATAELVHETIPTTPFVPVSDAQDGSEHVLDLGMFGGCFVCGQSAPEGLGVQPKALRDGRFAAIWKPVESGHITGSRVPAVYLRSALDCPGGFAALSANNTLALTGTLTSRIEFLPETETTLVVIGEATHADGRKLGAVSSIYTESGDLVATASAIWIAIPDTVLAPDTLAVA